MKLFEGINVAGMELKNRIVFPPTVSRRADMQGFVTEDMKDHYLRIAKGGVGLLEVEATFVQGPPLPTLPGLFDDEHIAGLKEMVDQIHAETDTKVAIQLIAPLWFWVSVEEMTIEHIESVIDSYAKASVRAKKAGFDAIGIHGAHGYTISGFLSLRNKRTDEYGKTLDGRMKLIKEVILRAKEECGKDFPIGVRINGDEFIVGGNTLEQTTKIAPRLCELGIAFLSVSAGGKNEDGVLYPGSGGGNWPYPDVGPWNKISGYSGHRCMPPAYMPDGVNVYLAAAIRESIKSFNVPVITAGKIPTPEFAESILQEGKADLIGLCRPLLCDPEWPNKAKEGKSDDIIHCVYCCGCVKDVRIGRPVVCHLKKKKGQDA